MKNYTITIDTGTTNTRVYLFNELCDEAMIRRATFYKHFADKYDFFFFFYPPKAGPVHLTGKRGNSPQRNLCLHALP